MLEDLTKKQKIILGFVVVFLVLGAASYAFANPGNGASGFVNTIHGTGPDHQANNEPGDTAEDRHNAADVGKDGRGGTPPAFDDGTTGQGNGDG